MIKMFLNFQFKMFLYLSLHKNVNPKYTTVDNSIFFYKLKNIFQILNLE